MSSNPNVRGSDIATLLGVIDPDATAASTVTTGWVSMGDVEQVMAVVFAGVLGTSATVDAKLEQATDGSGTGAKDITGKSITQLTEAGTDDDKQAIINCRSEELDVANDFDHVRLSVTVAVATSDIGGALFGFNARYQPLADASTVDEVVD